MNCPQCNTELPGASTYCFRCGSPIRTTAFSYLPAGSPPWPVVVPRDLDESSANSDKIIQREPVANVAERPRRNTRFALTTFFILALSAIIGVGISLGSLWANGQLFAASSHTRVHVPATPLQSVGAATPTPALSPTAQGELLPTPTSFQTVSSSDLGVSIKYPATWKKTGPQQASPDNFFVDFTPPQSLGIELVVRRISASASASVKSTSAVNQANLTDFSNVQGVQNLQPDSSAQPTIGGVQWDEQDATFSANQNTYRYVTISVQHKKMYFSIFFFAPDVVYNEALQKYIQPMLTSFKFLS